MTLAERLLTGANLTVLGMGLVFLLLGGVPTRSCVRGELSRTIDFVVLVAAVIVTQIMAKRAVPKPGIAVE